MSSLALDSSDASVGVCALSCSLLIALPSGLPVYGRAFLDLPSRKHERGEPQLTPVTELLAYLPVTATRSPASWPPPGSARSSLPHARVARRWGCTSRCPCKRSSRPGTDRSESSPRRDSGRTLDPAPARPPARTSW